MKSIQRLLLLIFLSFGVVPMILAQISLAEDLESKAFNIYRGNIIEAIRLETEALHIYEKDAGIDSLGYAKCLTRLAQYYYLNYNYRQTINFGTKALCLFKKVYTEEFIYDIGIIELLANSHQYLGNYLDAIKLYTENLIIQKKIIGKDDTDYIKTLNDLASCNAGLGRYSEAIRLGTEVLQIQEKTLGKDHPDYMRSLQDLMSYNILCLNYRKVVSLYVNTLRLQAEILEAKHPNYANNLKYLKYCNYGFGDEEDYQNADINLWKASGAMSIPPTSLSSYILTINNLIWYNRQLGHLSEALNLTVDESAIRRRLALDMSQRLSVEDRNSYWEMDKWHFERQYPLYAYRNRTPDFISVVYDAALLSKGFLLSSEIETRKIITESGDAALVALYDSMRVNQQILDKQLERPIKERFLNTDSLRETITQMERELASKSTTYGSLIANMSIEWKDVQKKLRKNDIAVEFLNFPIAKDSIMYVALTLKKGYKSPKMTPLFEEKQLKSIHKDRYYKGTNIYDLVWKPLEKELDGVTNVYFSPSGELYNINIEVLPEIAGITDSRRYYRLSSTRELALTRVDNNKQNASAAVYGGLRYYCAKDSLITDSRKYPRSKKRSIEDFDLSVDSIQLRSGYGYLEGTLLEAQKVDSSAVSAKMKSSLYTDFSGTEASFKALDGQGKQLIHIATHGFYYMEKDSVRMREKGFRMLQDESRRRYVEDKALTRSGLLFAGCNNILGGDTITLPEDVDDGILYAKEIARLDLRGLELLTLSACQTGLGDITGEGVFGLQRAFKKAGAKSILMSLWKVDDDATQMFMTRFYENYLIKKMPKSDALLDAQKYLRSKNEKDWAAFILLDAI